MTTNLTGDWRDLFDVALLEANRTKLRHCIERAKQAIHNRLDDLIHTESINDQSESGRTLAERIALSDALTTLAELHKIVFSRKPGASHKRPHAGAASQAGLL